MVHVPVHVLWTDVGREFGCESVGVLELVLFSVWIVDLLLDLLNGFVDRFDHVIVSLAFDFGHDLDWNYDDSDCHAALVELDFGDYDFDSNGFAAVTIVFYI